ALAAEVCAELGDADRAAVLYDMLLPHDGRTVVVVNGDACLGGVSRYLGRLAAAMRRWDAAARHFEDALTLHERMDAVPALARTPVKYAAMLLQRLKDDAGEMSDEAYGQCAQRARDLVEQGLTVAHELGMARLVQQAGSLKDEVERLIAACQAG